MIDKNNIPPIQSDFERIRKRDKNGSEYWTSRELCTALGYRQMWGGFFLIIRQRQLFGLVPAFP